MYQWQPLAPTIGVKARHVQGAVVQQRFVGLGLGEAIARWRNFVAADEFVDVLKAGVFARLDHGTAIFRHAHPGAFVRSAS